MSTVTTPFHPLHSMLNPLYSSWRDYRKAKGMDAKDASVWNTCRKVWILLFFVMLFFFTLLVIMTPLWKKKKKIPVMSSHFVFVLQNQSAQQTLFLYNIHFITFYRIKLVSIKKKCLRVFHPVRMARTCLDNRGPGFRLDGRLRG